MQETSDVLVVVEGARRLRGERFVVATAVADAVATAQTTPVSALAAQQAEMDRTPDQTRPHLYSPYA